MQKHILWGIKSIVGNRRKKPDASKKTILQNRTKHQEIALPEKTKTVSC